MVKLQPEPLSIAALQVLLDNTGQSGAQVSFCGTVRDDGDVCALELEHYPAMTQQAMQQLIAEAKRRWPLHQVILIHRIGRIELGQAIVWVGVSSAHRQEAFAACEFIMDTLKSRIPLWKKIHYRNGNSEWQHAKASDQRQAQRWLTNSAAPCDE